MIKYLSLLIYFIIAKIIILKAQRIAINGYGYHIGIFSMCANSSSFDERALLHYASIKYIVSGLNNNDDDSPNNLAGFISYDVCVNQTYLVEVVLTLLLGHRYQVKPSPYFFCKELKIFSVFAYLPDDMMKLAASMIYPEQIPFISLSDSILSPQAENEYYLQVDTKGSSETSLLAFIEHFNWTYIGIVNFDENQLENWIYEDTWQFFSSQANLCVVYKTVRNENDYMLLREMIMSDHALEVLIIYGSTRMKKKLLNDFINVTSKTFLMELVDPDLNNFVEDILLLTKHGIHFFYHLPSVFLSFHAKEISNLLFSSTNDPWLQLFSLKYDSLSSLHNNSKMELGRVGKILSVLSRNFFCIVHTDLDSIYLEFITGFLTLNMLGTRYDRIFTNFYC